MEKRERVYCGNGKIIKTKYGDMIKLGFSESDLKVLQENVSNGWVNAVMMEKREKKEGKPTHYIAIDDWKPDGDRTSNTSKSFVPSEHVNDTVINQETLGKVPF